MLGPEGNGTDDGRFGDLTGRQDRRETAALFDGEEAVERVHARAHVASDENDTEESIFRRQGC